MLAKCPTHLPDLNSIPWMRNVQYIGRYLSGATLVQLSTSHCISLRNVFNIVLCWTEPRKLSLNIFMCCWPCILVIFDFIFQLNAPLVYHIYQLPLHVSSNIVLIIRRIHCIHTASGSLYVTLLRWPLTGFASPLTACALSGHLRRVTYKEPDAVCIQ